MKKHKNEIVEKVEETKSTPPMEQSIWSVRINSQTLFRKPVDGRTILLGMTEEENKKVAEVMDKAIDDLTKILEKRTTQHESPTQKEPVTTVDVADQETQEQEPVQEEELSDKPAAKSEPAKKAEGKGKDGSWNSIFDKLRS